MRTDVLWNRAKAVKLQVSPEIAGNFDLGFDSRIPEETKEELRRFVRWAEAHFAFPVTLWVDFKYNHYLLDREGNRVGYRFYWADFASWPVFDNPEDIPVIELPVRTEHWSMEEILASFIEAISQYFAWLTNTITETTEPNEAETEEILQAYLSERSEKNGVS